MPGGGLVGVVGVEEREDGIAELGPLAVSSPGHGVRKRKSWTSRLVVRL